MAKAAILYTDLAALGSVTGDSSSTVANFGWDKLSDPQPRHRARVAAASAVLVWDLGSAQSVDIAALVSTSLPAAATARLRASTADPTVTGSLLYDSGVQSNVTSPDHNGNVVASFAAVNARYWRWDITGNDPIEIGLAPLGLAFHPGRNFQYGAQEGLIDLSVRDLNLDTGAEFGLSGPKKRTKLLTFSGLTKAEIRDTFGVIDRLVGMSGDVLFVEDPDAPFIDRARDSILGSYRQAGPDLATRQGAAVWSRSMRLTERL
jgi:hypothetical protein